ncbi:MAG: glycosyltransferase family 39 protein [Bryobacteraceae bacterium]
MNTRVVWAAIALLVGLTRFCHIDLVWTEEAYPLAAAAEVLRGKMLYRDIWFDKPPFYALVYTLWGAQSGWPLRLAGAVYVLLACACVWRFARDLWGETEALWAAFLLAFFLTFGIPSAVMVLAPDLLMIVPHVLAVWLSWRRRPVAAGVLCGLAMLVNSKGLFVLAACLLWPGRVILLSSFALTQFGSALVLPSEYWSQVWTWGFRYSADSFYPFLEGVKRTGNWVGFTQPLLLPPFVSGASEAGELVSGCSFPLPLCLAAGDFSRYYFHLLPVITLCAARGGVTVTPTQSHRTRPTAGSLVPLCHAISLAQGDQA